MKEKGISRWWVLIVIPIIIGAIGFYYLTNPTEIPSMTTTTTTTETTIGTYAITGNRVFDEQVSGDKIIQLNAGRYSLSFQSNENTEVSLKKNPNGFLVCCNVRQPKQSGVYEFDINSGAGGDYLLSITKPSQIIISQSLSF